MARGESLREGEGVMIAQSILGWPIDGRVMSGFSKRMCGRKDMGRLFPTSPENHTITVVSARIRDPLPKIH